jgi:hypothetical protein
MKTGKSTATGSDEENRSRVVSSGVISPPVTQSAVVILLTPRPELFAAVT